jgi:hypothetical protein
MLYIINNLYEIIIMKTLDNESIKLEYGIIDLYNDLKDQIFLETQKKPKCTSNVNAMEIINSNYLKQMMDVLISAKVDSHLDLYKEQLNYRETTLQEEERTSYEDLLKKLEAEIRNHIKV